MKRVKGPNDVPNVPHYAVIIYSTTSVYVEGDERSRTSPGHGYPAHTDNYDTFEHYVTTEKSTLEAFVSALELSKKPYSTPKPYVFFRVDGKGHMEIKPAITFN